MVSVKISSTVLLGQGCLLEIISIIGQIFYIQQTWMINRLHGVFPFFHTLNLYSLFTFFSMYAHLPLWAVILMISGKAHLSVCTDTGNTHCLKCLLLGFFFSVPEEMRFGNTIYEWIHLIFWETSFKITAKTFISCDFMSYSVEHRSNCHGKLGWECRFEYKSWGLVCGFEKNSKTMHCSHSCIVPISVSVRIILIKRII